MRWLLPRLLGALAACVLVGWRVTLRIRIEGDPRPALRASGRRYVYAILHAQQLSFILLSDDVPIQAMVSASTDGDWLVPLCRARSIIPIRGSTRRRGEDKGGRAALAQLAAGVRQGTPALLAVDGPRGPRNCVHRGIVDLARETDACIVVASVFPKARFILERTWDRTQLPRPFSTKNLPGESSAAMGTRKIATWPAGNAPPSCLTYDATVPTRPGLRDDLGNPTVWRPKLMENGRSSLISAISFA